MPTGTSDTPTDSTPHTPDAVAAALLIERARALEAAGYAPAAAELRDRARRLHHCAA